jgi:hypothetical protein
MPDGTVRPCCRLLQQCIEAPSFCVTHVSVAHSIVYRICHAHAHTAIQRRQADCSSVVFGVLASHGKCAVWPSLCLALWKPFAWHSVGTHKAPDCIMFGIGFQLLADWCVGLTCYLVGPH